MDEGGSEQEVINHRIASPHPCQAMVDARSTIVPKRRQDHLTGWKKLKLHAKTQLSRRCRGVEWGFLDDLERKLHTSPSCRFAPSANPLKVGRCAEVSKQIFGRDRFHERHFFRVPTALRPVGQLVLPTTLERETKTNYFGQEHERE